VTVPVAEQLVEKQSELSARAKAVFEESVRQYEAGEGEGVLARPQQTPPPLPPKTDRPPLPPKQRSRRGTEEPNEPEQTYVNSAEVRAGRTRTRLTVSHTPSPAPAPVVNTESAEFVYGSYYSGQGGAQPHKVSVPVGRGDSPAPAPAPAPSLPPKELRLAEVSDTKQVKRKGVTSTRIVGTNAKPMKSVETQTDENDFYLLYPEDESYQATDSEYSPESNRSLSPEYGGAPAHPATPGYTRAPQEKSAAEFYLGSSVASTLFERPVSAQSLGARQAGRRRLEPVQSVPAHASSTRVRATPATASDPVIAGEINWSVSQLRTLFNQGLARSAAQQQQPELYCSSPTYRAQQARQSKLLDQRRVLPQYTESNYVNMYRDADCDQDSDQESYV